MDVVKEYIVFMMNTEEYRTTKNIHDGNIFDLLMIDDNTFLSGSFDKTIKVWKY